MAGWNFPDVWEVVATTLPDSPALVHGCRRVAWAEFDDRADGLAQVFLDAGLTRHDKVAQYLFNCPEYMESVYAAFKAALVPVNTNYRYGAEELTYLWTNADAAAVVFHGCFTELVDGLLPRLPGVRLWVWVDDGSGPCPDWATPYDVATKAASGRVVPPWGRSGDDPFFLYTGGTTGYPKGVMWRQDDLFVNLTAASGLGEAPDLDAVRAQVTAPGLTQLAAAPLMHGTGALTAMAALASGGCVITLPSRRFDPVELLDTVERERVGSIVLVGDAFAKPVLEALDAHPRRWDLSSLVAIGSSGTMWSEQTKQGLLGHHPGLMLIDSLGSSEALGAAQSVSGGDGVAGTARFQLGPMTRVLTDDGRDVEPGSGEIGRLVVGGRLPLGYYKDEERTRATFVTVDGQRYAMAGDWATVAADGTVTLLGRGSGCINTGGEKVFPEEVEEVLKVQPGVADAVVVGVPDERLGEAVVAVVQPRDDAELDEAALIASVKGRLASYKAPKRVIVAPVERGPNGKVDYPAVQAAAAASRPGG